MYYPNVSCSTGRVVFLLSITEGDEACIYLSHYIVAQHMLITDLITRLSSAKVTVNILAKSPALYVPLCTHLAPAIHLVSPSPEPAPLECLANPVASPPRG